MEILRETSSSLILVIDACSSQPCLNGGICNATASGFSCSCSPLLTGVRCEIGIGKFCDKGNFKGHLYLLSEVACDCTGSAQQGSMTGVEY